MLSLRFDKTTATLARGYLTLHETYWQTVVEAIYVLYV